MLELMAMRVALLLMVLFSTLSTSLLPASKRDWKQGTLVSIDMMTIPMTPKRVAHRYQVVVSDGEYLYTMEYEKPIKVAVHDSVKFVIDKERMILLDADDKERSTRIEKRERLTR